MGAIDMTGKRYGMLTVIRYAGHNKNGNRVWECKCDCGTIKMIEGSPLRKGITVSCGCYHKRDITERETIHGMSDTRLHNIWNHMKQRCSNKNNTAYKYYGGRGITVCNEWSNDFMSFYSWAMQNGYTEELTIDRIDTNKGYDPSNCRWVSRKVQMNNRNAVHKFTINGETKSIAEWCRIYNVPHERVRRRVMNEGWDIVTALTTPALKKNGKPL